MLACLEPIVMMGKLWYYLLREKELVPTEYVTLKG